LAFDAIACSLGVMSREYVVRPFRKPIELQINYAAELNEQQLAAVTAPPGPALVIAGAGSGKTRTLTYRVAFLLEQGIPPDRILLLTFTNKAAKEMMRRVADLVGQEISELWGGTFHSIGNRILRIHAPRLGYGRDFTILDREDADDLISTCVTDVRIEAEKHLFPKAAVLADIFSMAANTQKSLEEIISWQHDDFLGQIKEIEAVLEAYRKRKLATNSMDFDDLLVLWLKLLQEHADVREQFQKRFQFVLVDEYQDTNRLQSDVIDILAEKQHNLMVVGDDAQSIYAWRGANYENILRFPDRYPKATTYKIEVNYRSTPEILQLANATIAHNVRQFPKELTAAKKPGIKPVLAPCEDTSQQAAFVAQRVLELHEEGVNLNDMAVLYRAHFHAMELQMELTRRGIPFTVTSGIRYFEQVHIKDVSAYLKLVMNPRDEISFKRLAKMLPGVGPKAADKLWQSYLQLVPADTTGFALAPALQSCARLAPKKAAVGWTQFAITISQVEAPKAKGVVHDMIRTVIEAGYEDYLKANYENYRTRLEDLQQFAVMGRQYTNLQEFLSQLALLSNAETETQDANASEDRLRLSTIHQAKGLEFDVVFVIMLCDGLFPSNRALDLPDGEEEERRLMYVALTRARNELYLSYPLLRMSYDRSSPERQMASRFIREMPTELMDGWNLRRHY
jgi:DNA helicase-2/ATP-dependent DNA helicase PcrA